MRIWIIGVAIIAVLGVGVGAMAVGYFEQETAVTVAPREAVLFASVSIDPSISQKRAIVSLLDRLPAEAQEKVGESVPKMLDELFAEADVDYEKDVKPWLGGEIAGFVMPGESEPAGAVIVATKDQQRAVDFVLSSAEKELEDLKTATYRGVEYTTAEDDMAFAGVAEFLVFGTVAGIEASVDASLDGGLSTDEEFTALDGALTDDRLLSYFVDGKGIVELVKQSGDLSESELDEFAQLDQLGTFGEALQQSSAGAVYATRESVVFESVSTIPEDRDEALAITAEDAELLPSLPASTWLGAAIPNIGASAEQLLSGAEEMAQELEDPLAEEFGMDLREDVLSWMQDGTLFVTGETIESLAGGLVIGSDDPSKTAAFVKQIEDLLTEQQAPLEPASEGSLSGFTVADPELPVTGTVLGGDRLVVGIDQAGSERSSISELLGEGPRLAEDATFVTATDALGVDYAPTFYVDITRAVALAKSALEDPSMSEQMDEADPYLDILSSFVVGTREDADLRVTRAILTTQEP